VLSFFQSSITAQTYSNKASSVFSFKVGLTSSNLFHDSVSYKSAIMLNGGFAYSLRINERVNAGIELLYTGKAFKTDSPIIKYRNFFIDIPLFAQINLSESIRLDVGGQYSIATTAHYIMNDTSAASGVKKYKTDPIKPFDYGFLLGVEFDINKNIALGARYTISGPLLFAKNDPDFGVFQFTIKYSPIRTYKVFFGKKEEKQ
jgi:long-subunit fatty acid transport protein